MGERPSPDEIAEIEREFPAIRTDQYEVTSDRTTQYNCIAWAVGRTDEWWDPFNAWPEEAPRELTMEAYQAAFASEGFEVCDSQSLEHGVEKIAIYKHAGAHEPSHAARQLADGSWTSKLGSLEDVRHATLAQLGGPQGYGDLAAYMRRERRG